MPLYKGAGPIGFGFLSVKFATNALQVEFADLLEELMEMRIDVIDRTASCASPKPCLASKELILPVGDCGLTGLVEQGQNPPGILLPGKNSGHRQWAQSWVAGDPAVPYPDAVEAERILPL